MHGDHEGPLRALEATGPRRPAPGVARRSWGIHVRRSRLDLVRDGVIALERPRAGDLAALGDDASALYARLREAYPSRSPGQVRGWTHALLRFAHAARAGDLVVHPDPRTRTF